VEPPLKPKLRVLGLFEGIGTGRHVLRELGLDVEKYYSSEIDKDAIRVQLHNFGDQIIHLGDVREVTSAVLDDMGEIHLLIGGSPCADLSLVNFRRKNFDASGSGVLFYEYARILEYLLKKSRERGGTPLYWLFENTCKMEKKSVEIIKRTLGCEPVTVCASQFTPMERKRYFWGNLIGMSSAIKNPGPREVPSLREVPPSYKTVVCDTLPTLTGNKEAQRS
ncbi:DNA (cytosine-5)-methyltransferase 3C, partial [Frankliniella fusca]